MSMISGYLISASVVFLLLPLLDDGPNDSLIFTLVLLIPVFGFTGWQNIKRQKRMFESFQLTITEDAVIPEQLYTPTITIPRNRINEIFRTGAGVICIVGDSKLNAIGVPAQIENRDALEQALSEISPIVSKSQWTPKVLLQLVAVLAIIIGCPIGLLVGDRLVMTISGVLLCAFLVLGFILIRRSKNFDSRMRRMSYVVFFPVVAILYYVMLSWKG